MKKFKKLTSLFLAVLMVCTSFAWNGLEVKAGASIIGTATGDASLCDEENFSNIDVINEKCLKNAEAYTSSNFEIVSVENYPAFKLNSNAKGIKVPIMDGSTEITIEFSATKSYSSTVSGTGAVCAGGTGNFVWKNDSITADVDVTIKLIKMDDTTWQSQYTEDNGTTWNTVNGEAVYDEVTITDNNIYFIRNNMGAFMLKDFKVTFVGESYPYSVNGTKYATLEEAVSDASDAYPIVLMSNTSVNDEYLTKDITVDLNGYTLTANSLVTFDADIVDNSVDKTGLLVCDKLMVPQNSQMPVYDSSANGYRLVTVTHQIAQKTDDSTQTTKYLSLTVRPGFEGVDSIHSLLAGGNSKVRMGIRLTWDDGNCVQDCYFSSDLVKAMYGNNKAASFTLTGLDAYEDLTATSIVISNDANKESVYATPCSPASVTTAE